MIKLPHTVPGVVAMMLRMALGALFVWTGWMKTREPIEFLFSIRSFQILEDPWAAWVAMGLPWLEVAAGGALVLGVCIEGGLVVIAGMLGVFLGAIIYSWQRGLNLSCGCFGGDASVSDYHEIIQRDIVLLTVTLILLAHRWVVYHRMRKLARQPLAGEP